MRIRRSVLARYIDVPREPRRLRDLLDEVGIEVKRMEEVPGDLAMTLELLANRGDHHAYNGIAREISGHTSATVATPPVTDLDTASHPSQVQVGDLTLRCETPLCPVYTGTLLVRDEPGLGQLDADALAPIIAADQNPVSAPVDATNLSNLEFGQPTHCFDADTIVGALVIRTSVAGETAWPLFQEERVSLPEGTLVIADDEKILAVAGVIGCQESRTTESTRRILLESAHFDPVSVRKASRALNILTDSSARFERGSDPSAPLVGAGRVAHLLTTHAGWRIHGTTGVVGTWEDPRRIINLSVHTAAAFLEYPLHDGEIRERLSRYGFQVSPVWPDWDAELGWYPPADLADVSKERLRNSVLVRVPPHRLWDVEERADLYEELAKSIGYDNTPTHLPPIDLGSLPTPAEERRARATEVLLAHGFYEVVLDGFHGRDIQERLGLPEGHVLTRNVETQNALDRAYSLLKNNALAQAMEGVAVNLNVRNTQVKAFEWTRTFHPDPAAANGVCTERRVLWAVATGRDREPGWAGHDRPADALYLKGIVENMAVELGLPLQVGPADPDQPLAVTLHPGRQATVLLDDEVVGIFGEVHPRVVAAFKIKRARPVYLELDGDALSTEPIPTAWEMPTTNQPIDRNLAFTLPIRVEAGAIARTLEHSGPDWLSGVDIVDLFAHEEDGAPVRTITYALRFSTDEASRSADEVNGICQNLIEAVEGAWGSRGVKLRA